LIRVTRRDVWFHFVDKQHIPPNTLCLYIYYIYIYIYI
jgi:hypothetical protein